MPWALRASRSIPPLTSFEAPVHKVTGDHGFPNAFLLTYYKERLTPKRISLSLLFVSVSRILLVSLLCSVVSEELRLDITRNRLVISKFLLEGS